jgi:hypothetical protein
MGAISILRPSLQLRDGTDKWFLKDEFGEGAKASRLPRTEKMGSSSAKLRISIRPLAGFANP